MPGYDCSSESVSRRRLAVLTVRSFCNTRTLTDLVRRDHGDMTEKILVRPEGLVRSGLAVPGALVEVGAVAAVTP